MWGIEIVNGMEFCQFRPNFLFAFAEPGYRYRTIGCGGTANKIIIGFCAFQSFCCVEDKLVFSEIFILECSGGDWGIETFGCVVEGGEIIARE